MFIIINAYLIENRVYIFKHERKYMYLGNNCYEILSQGLKLYEVARYIYYYESLLSEWRKIFTRGLLGILASGVKEKNFICLQIKTNILIFCDNLFKIIIRNILNIIIIILHVVFFTLMHYLIWESEK